MMVYQMIDGTLAGFYRESGQELVAMYYRDVYKQVTTEITEMVLTISPSNIVLEKKWIPGHFEDVTFYVPERQEYQYVVIEGHWEYTTWTEEAHWGTREYWLEPHIEIQYRDVIGHYEPGEVYVQGRYERQFIEVPEYSVTRYREVVGHYEPGQVYVQGHYETQSIWTPAYYVTRYYWREASEARRLPAAWIPYEYLIPAGYKDQRVWVDGSYEAGEVWVDTFTESYQEIIPAGVKEQRVWIDGHYEAGEVWVDTYSESYEVEIPGVWQERRIWFPDVTRTTKAWIDIHEVLRLVTIPPTSETKNVWVPIREIEYSIDYGSKEVWAERTWYETELVFVGYMPVYSLQDPATALMFTVEELVRADPLDPDAHDYVVLRNALTGEVLETNADFLGHATRIGDNEYVLAE